MKKSVHVLHTIPGHGGGIASYVRNLTTATSDDNITMDVAGFGVFPEEYVNAINSSNGNVYTLPNSHKYLIGFIRQYCEILKANKYDVVHCHFSGVKGLVIKILSKCMGVPIIATHAHTTSYEKKGLFYGLKVRISQITSCIFSDLCFTCSSMAAEFIYGNKYSSTHSIYMMPNTINPALYENELCEEEKLKFYTELDIPEGATIIGHVGRFNTEKNHIFMIKIAKRLCEEKFPFFLIFIGDGDEFNNIKIKAEQAKLDDKIRFLGKRNDVNKLFQIMEMIILPSFYEGLPTVAIEAQAAGTFVALSDTITREANLELGLMEYLPINQGVECWCDVIKRKKRTTRYTIETRLKKIKEKGFNDKSMRERYSTIITNKVDERRRNA